MNSLTLATIFMFISAGWPPEVMRGTVRSTTGNSLSDVFVFFDRGIADIEMTKLDGTFSVSHHGRYVAFLREGYRPVIKIVDSKTETLDVVLESGESTEWNVPSCSTLKAPGKRIGFLLRFFVPKGAKTHQGGDADYTAFDMEFSKGRERTWIRGGVGPSWSHAGPKQELILGAAEFTVRSYRAANWNGFDVRGRSKDGEYWRYLGTVGQSVNYRVSSQESAAELDKVIDGACY